MIKKVFNDGELYDFKNINILFSNKNFNEKKHSLLKNKTIGSCNQIHSNILMPYKSDVIHDCDALYASRTEPVALKIKTADCIPLFVFNAEQVFAVHAGWRGICHNIIGALKDFSFDKNSYAVIGPHIKHYEVGEEVIAKIVQRIPAIDNNNLFYRPSPNDGKFILNLQTIATFQLQKIGLLTENIIASGTDTYTNDSWHSYRRDNKAAGRNFSYILAT